MQRTPQAYPQHLLLFWLIAAGGALLWGALWFGTGWLIARIQARDGPG